MLWHRTQLLRIDKSVIIRFFIFHFLQNRKEYINGITIYNNYWSNILYMGVRKVRILMILFLRRKRYEYYKNHNTWNASDGSR